jgi:hypothetical protein
MFLRGVRALVGGAIVAALVVAAGGCEGIIGNTIPAFGCTGTAASDCPANQICAPALGQCVPRSTACTVANNCAAGQACNPDTQKCETSGADASAGDVDQDTGIDAGIDSPPPSDGADGSVCNIVGCPCSSNRDCVVGDVCEGSSILTSIVGTGKICTKPCCASSDCGEGNVCFAAGTGGNYCVPATMAGVNGANGTAGGGAACPSGNGDCRSGRCGTDGKCLDACCTDSSCASGTQCGYDPNVNGGVLQCETVNPGTTTQDNSCGTTGADPQCHGNYCNDYGGITGRVCITPCCGSTNCGAGNACFDVNFPGSNNWLPFCYQNQDFGTKAFGATCQTNADCASDHCLGGFCTDVCCTDADCSANPAWKCQPFFGTSGTFLRCGSPQ